MPTTLVIVESPAKCKKIESYLGPGYKVIASFGHLRHIDGLKSVDIENNFETKYSIINEDVKLKQIEKIRSEIAKADDIIIATDADREGEAIGWHICDLFGLGVTNTKRIVFNEITEPAIQRAIIQPKRINLDLVYAQQARQILDLLVGFTISPVLWKCVSKQHDKSLSAGRCQTPALRLVYENYLDIKKSEGQLVYNVIGHFTSLNLPFELNKQLNDASIVRDFLEQCKTWPFVYTTTEPKKTIRKSPEPLTTSTLQQLASTDLRMSPKETMKHAQQLYESGLITYMRTESKKYSAEFVLGAKTYIISTYGAEYVSNSIDNLSISETAEEAHEAIRPVNINITSASDLHSKTMRLYELIWKRTVESCMPSAQYSVVSAKISAPLASHFVFKAEQPIFLGWQRIAFKSDDNNYYTFLQSLKQGSIEPKKINAKFTLIGEKSHYCEAKLVKLLEDKGIGRPSTFASIVDKIQERKYVVKQNVEGKTVEAIDFELTTDKCVVETVSKKVFGNEKDKLVIQPLGIIVIEFLLEKFDRFFDYDYTKEMEDLLDKIAKGEYTQTQLCSTYYRQLVSISDTLKAENKFALTIDEQHSLIVGKFGPVVKRTDENGVISFLKVKADLDVELLKQQRRVRLEDILDSKNETAQKSIGKYRGKDLYIKKGKYGIYAQWGSERKSLKEEFDTEDIPYIDVIRYLDRDTVLDPSKPVGFVRELNAHLSIRTGKFGDYIFYKKPRAKKAEFLKLKGFESDYKKCDKTLLLDWIKQTYNVE